VQTRRDQLHAYRFQNQRALAALITGEPNVLEPPMRRLTVFTVSGIMIAILIACGFALVGVFKPATGDKWRDAGAIIVERETGARYVLVDGVLHPVLNYSSAVLAVGGNQHPHVVLVDRSDLTDVKRGATIGIDGIPDSLPSPSRLVSSPWTVCSRQSAGTGQELSIRVSLRVGSAAGARPLPDATGVLVRPPGAPNAYLLLHGQRLEVSSGAVATSLQLPVAASLQVGTAFLDGVPAGPPLKAPEVPGSGTASGKVSVGGQPVQVGRLLHTTDDDRYFLTLADGVAALDPVQTQLLLTLPLGPGGQPVAPLATSETAVLNLPQSATDWARVADQMKGLPAKIPQVATAPAQNGGICAVYRSGTGQPAFAVPGSTLPPFSADQVVQSDRSRQGLADEVVLPPGRAAVVRSSGGAATLFVIADPGRKYAVTSPEVLSGFGYDAQPPATVPFLLLPLIAPGPALDPQAARRPVTA
jgi:type VII secretion protein EccB